VLTCPFGIAEDVSDVSSVFSDIYKFPDTTAATTEPSASDQSALSSPPLKNASQQQQQRTPLPARTSSFTKALSAAMQQPPLGTPGATGAGSVYATPATSARETAPLRPQRKVPLRSTSAAYVPPSPPTWSAPPTPPTSPLGPSSSASPASSRVTSVAAQNCPRPVAPARRTSATKPPSPGTAGKLEDQGAGAAASGGGSWFRLGKGLAAGVGRFLQGEEQASGGYFDNTTDGRVL
jgi:hypothetical protein